jgi:hypothetical protein
MTALDTVMLYFAMLRIVHAKCQKYAIMLSVYILNTIFLGVTVTQKRTGMPKITAKKFYSCGLKNRLAC